jgi:hypothetical protein
MTSCCHRTTVCVDTPARPYLVWPTGIITNLCPPCAQTLRELGMDLREDDRPEWRRRLPAKDMTQSAT